WEQVRPLPAPGLALPDAIRAEARARADAVDAVPRAGLVLRCAAAGETLAVAREGAAALGRGLARVEGEPPRGLSPWLIAAEVLPVFTPHPGPGERWVCPDLAPYDGPWIAAPGIDGAIEGDPQGPPPDDWTLPVPRPGERARLWRQAGLS